MLLSEVARELPWLPGHCNVRGMSLNRTERILFDYIGNHVEERQFWQGKVRDLMSGSRDDPASSAALAGELRRYCEERSRVGALPAQVIDDKGLGRFGYRNLAEYLMRIWGPVRPARPTDHSKGDEIS